MSWQTYKCWACALVIAGCSADTTDQVAAEGPKPDGEPASAATEPDTAAGAHGRVLHEGLERFRREFAGTFGEPLPEFAAKCDLATGIHVPDFTCANGTEVPISHFANGKCDKPNRLNKQCDPGSRFQIVAQTTDAVAVAHCRKEGNSGNNFGDIAIIQYNKVNGATCFYQALGVMDGNFKSPGRGTSLASDTDSPNGDAAPWLSSAATKHIGCAGCHDNGAMIRSPYITQMSFMPGAGDNTYNRTNPVSYIGTDFESWQTYSVNVTGNFCVSCHRQGTSRVPINGVNSTTGGTARDFALRATQEQPEAAKNPHSFDSPIWMPPGGTFYSLANENSAKAIAACANAWTSNSALPSGCTVSPLSTPFTGMTPALAKIVTTIL